MFPSVNPSIHLDLLPNADRRQPASDAEIRLRIRRLTRTGA